MGSIRFIEIAVDERVGEILVSRGKMIRGKIIRESFAPERPSANSYATRTRTAPRSCESLNSSLLSRNVRARSRVQRSLRAYVLQFV